MFEDAKPGEFKGLLAAAAADDAPGVLAVVRRRFEVLSEVVDGDQLRTTYATDKRPMHVGYVRVGQTAPGQVTAVITADGPVDLAALCGRTVILTACGRRWHRGCEFGGRVRRDGSCWLCDECGAVLGSEVAATNQQPAEDSEKDAERAR